MSKSKEMLEMCEGIGVFYTCDWCGEAISSKEMPVSVVTKIGKNMLFHKGCVADFEDAIQDALSGVDEPDGGNPDDDMEADDVGPSDDDDNEKDNNSGDDNDDEK